MKYETVKPTAVTNVIPNHWLGCALKTMLIEVDTAGKIKKNHQ
jgi:hypothetical protein